LIVGRLVVVLLLCFDLRQETQSAVELAQGGVLARGLLALISGLDLNHSRVANTSLCKGT
jgi:hypothetical protein